ncbi:MAG: cytochrome c3 family protein [Anaerolineaceae bacterium]|nr:cytochrome c3 family protein [Anaerolineaceae bacterium]
MNKRTFLLLLALIAAALVGWVVWSTSQAKAAPVDANAIGAKWWGSAHNDIKGEAFSHWNKPAKEGEEPAVPPTCAKCHSTAGFVDFLGGDKTEAGKVDNPAPIMQGVQCAACHNSASADYKDVAFPSGVILKDQGRQAVCMTCHQGMSAGVAVDKNKLVVAAGTGADDTVLEKSSLVAPHYFHAAAVHAGTDAKSGYEYQGKTYVGTFQHDEKVNNCTECHDPHSLWIKHAEGSKDSLCSTCHQNVKSYEDYRKVPGKVDYDGDGQVEPVAEEIKGVEALLEASIAKYSAEKLGKPLGFFYDAYPYAYNDTNADGKIDETEAKFPNAYNTFSPRLLKACFNLMFSHKEPGAYVHNAKYVLQLMYDSIEDLGGSVAGMARP